VGSREGIGFFGTQDAKDTKDHEREWERFEGSVRGLVGEDARARGGGEPAGLEEGLVVRNYTYTLVRYLT
jgi:hypothetical protein